MREDLCKWVILHGHSTTKNHRVSGPWRNGKFLPTPAPAPVWLREWNGKVFLWSLCEDVDSVWGKTSTRAFYTGLFMTWSLLSSRGCFYLDQLNLSPWSSCISWTLPPWLFVCNNPASLSFVHNNLISLFNSVWWTCWVSRVMRFPQMKALAT